MFDYGPTERVKTSCCRGKFIECQESIRLVFKAVCNEGVNFSAN